MVPAQKPNIAVFTPLNPIKSGISDYNHELLPALAKHYYIDVFVDDSPWDFPVSTDKYRVFHHLNFARLYNEKRYQAVIYHLGNNLFSNYMYSYLANYPGVVVLHDTVLHGLRAMHYLGRNQREHYEAEIMFSHGEGALSVANLVASGMVSPLLLRIFPMLRIPVESAKIVLVHSRAAMEQVVFSFPGAKVQTVPMAFRDPYPHLQKETQEGHRDSLNIDVDAYPVLGSFGFVTQHKRLSIILPIFKDLLRKYPRAKYYIVGKVLPEYENELAELIQGSDLSQSVIPTGYVDMETYYRYMRAVDIAINLRYPTYGETSASLIRLLGCGVPTIVSNLHQFAQIPDSAVAKVDIYPNEVDQLRQMLELLIEDKKVRDTLAANAAAYISKNNSLTDTISAYKQAIDFAMQQPFKPSLLLLHKELSHLTFKSHILTGMGKGILGDITKRYPEDVSFMVSKLLLRAWNKVVR